MTDTVVVTELSSGVVEVVSQGPQGPSGLGTATAGGVLSGNYPNPGFAVDMATQAELDAVSAAKQSVSGKDASGGYPGLTLFKLNLRNAANTFTSWFTTAATAARTWTMPDKDGTVAMTSDFAAPGAIGGTTPAAGTFTTLTSTGNAALGDTEASDTHAIKGATTLLANSASAALTVTQTGAGNAFVVEDSASTDSTPVIINTQGVLVVGHTAQLTDTYVDGYVQLASNSGAGTTINQALYSLSGGSAPYHIFSRSNTATIGGSGIATSGDDVGYLLWTASDGANQIRLAQILAQVDGTPGTNDMPGRLVFSTTADGASSPTERMRIDSAGNVGIGGAATAGTLDVQTQLTGGTFKGGIISRGQIQSGVSSRADNFLSVAACAAGSYTSIVGYQSQQGTISGTVTNLLGFQADASLTGATNNYGFYSNIASSSGRWNFYAAGTAANYFGGNVTVGGGGTLGYGAGSGGTVTQATSKSTSVTLNKPSGQITMHNASLAAGAVATFEINNSTFASTDVLAFAFSSGAAAGSYSVVQAYGTAGVVGVTLRNVSAGSLSEAVVLNFTVIKGSTT